MLQSVPVHACMSHCIGMLAPGTEQLTVLTSINKLIAGDTGGPHSLSVEILSAACSPTLAVTAAVAAAAASAGCRQQSDRMSIDTAGMIDLHY